MKFYAMIDGVQKGPFDLHQIPELNIRPDTYVWSKGMEKWEKAEDVAEICRFYRQRITSLMHPTIYQPVEDSSNQSPSATDETSAPGFSRIGMGFPDAPLPSEENPAIAPRSILLAALYVTVFCFPLTGAVAVFYSMKSKRLWNSSRVEEGEKARSLQIKSHSANRMAKMWTGISFFLGMILWSLMFFKIL